MSKKVTDVDKHVGAKIRMARTMRHISQQKLADAVGLTFQQVQKYETGKNGCRSSRLLDIARFLNMPISYFFDGLDQPGFVADPYNTIMTRFFSQTHARELAESFMRLNAREQSLVASTATALTKSEAA